MKYAGDTAGGEGRTRRGEGEEGLRKEGALQRCKRRSGTVHADFGHLKFGKNVLLSAFDAAVTRF